MNVSLQLEPSHWEVDLLLAKEICFSVGSRVHLQMLACWVVFTDQNPLLAET